MTLYSDELRVTFDYKRNTPQAENITTLFKHLLYGACHVKLSTNRLDLSYDRNDPSRISGIKNLKAVIEDENGNAIIVKCALQNNFKARPFAAEMYIFEVLYTNTPYKDVEGAHISLYFTDVASDASTYETFSKMAANIVDDSRFVFNLNQFDEFMEIFKFYQSLSDELNNNKTYPLVGPISRPYWYLPAEAKGYESEFKNEIYDQYGVIKGYRLNESEYLYLNNELKDQAERVIDVRIADEDNAMKALYKIGSDNIYLSSVSHVKESDLKNIQSFVIRNIVKDKNDLILAGTMKSDELMEEDYSYLNLYDMGQKIKIESIDNSLRLINQGGTGAATKMLEYLIGDKSMPNNGGKKPDSITNKYCKGLNNSQKRAFLMAIDGSPVSLIKGPPGTGKTHVINAIVSYITKELGEKVVISSQTHIAIDNVLDKLMENKDLIIPNRITNRRNKYSGPEIDKTLYKTWGKSFAKYNKGISNKSLSAAMEKSLASFKGEERFSYYGGEVKSEYSVIGATTTTSAIAGKKGLDVLKGYDWLVIDEVSKCPITEVLRYLPYVERIIMVGDDFQLAPLLEFNKEDVKDLPSYDEDKFQQLQLIYEQSVFAKVLSKAKKAKRLVVLEENYRSVKDVLSAYNVFYDGALKARREDVRPEKVHFKKDGDIDFESKDIFFVEVLGGQEVMDGTSRFNIEEINATAKILRSLMDNALDAKNMTVSAIFPYGAQINRFKKMNLKLINEAKQTFQSFEIDTVDAFQGKESDVVLVNTVVADSRKGNFLNDFRRINVMMSRAKDKLIIFGNNKVLKNIDMKVTGGESRHYFLEIYKHIYQNGKIIEYRKGELL